MSPISFDEADNLFECCLVLTSDFRVDTDLVDEGSWPPQQLYKRSVRATKRRQWLLKIGFQHASSLVKGIECNYTA